MLWSQGMTLCCRLFDNISLCIECVRVCTRERRCYFLALVNDLKELGPQALLAGSCVRTAMKRSISVVHAKCFSHRCVAVAPTKALEAQRLPVPSLLLALESFRLTAQKPQSPLANLRSGGLSPFCLSIFCPGKPPWFTENTVLPPEENVFDIAYEQKRESECFLFSRIPRSFFRASFSEGLGLFSQSNSLFREYSKVNRLMFYRLKRCNDE